MTMKTAQDLIAQAIAEKAIILLDHETRAFAGFRFQLSDEVLATVVRVHKKTAPFLTLTQAAA
jgi:hypothetical protein